MSNLIYDHQCMQVCGCGVQRSHSGGRARWLPVSCILRDFDVKPCGAMRFVRFAWIVGQWTAMACSSFIFLPTGRL